MKDIKLYIADKYNNDEYEPVEEGIYLCNDEYVISLSFVQEPEFGEEEYASCISQYPLEDILDEYLVYVSDFYEELNSSDSKICFIEFASSELSCIQKLKYIIGKHIYNSEICYDGKNYVKLIIE